MTDTTREYVVVLNIINDDPTKSWWQAMGLLDPARWGSDDAFGPTVYVKPILEVEVNRKEN